VEPLRAALLRLANRHSVLVEGPAPPSHSAGTARVLGLVGPRIAIESVCEGDTGLLVLDLASLPGWRAYVDGSPVSSIRRVNFGFMGIPVPRGRHLVSLVYWTSPGAIAELLASLAAIAILLASRRARALGFTGAS
jgi:hypothetical protein